MNLSQFLRPILIVALGFPMLLQAEVRRDESVLWRRARTLPGGQQVFSFQSSYQNFSDRYGADGRAEPLGRPYARALTWNQLLKADAANAQEIRDYMRNAKVTGNDIAATADYEVKREEVGFGFNWAYGLMRNWMIGLEIPIRLTTTRVRRQVEMTPQLQRGAGQAGKSVLALQAADLRERVRKMAEDELASSGYDSIPSQRQAWNFGDISLRSQEALASSYHWRWSLQQQLRFPTAQNPSVADYVQSSQDEGPINLGISTLLDFTSRKTVSGLRGGYVVQMPDSARMHARPGSSGVDPKVNRDLGDWLWVAADTQYRVTRRLDFNLEYSYLAKARDRYTGDAFSSQEYAQLADNTDMQLHQTRVGMLLRLGEISTRAGVSNKWLASLDYTYPWIGRNASEASRASLEIINYF